MKQLLLFCWVGLLSVASVGGTLAIYGTDARGEIFELKNTSQRLSANAVAAMVLKSNVHWNPITADYSLDSLVYGQAQNLCVNERFYNQPAVANCTSFLVGPDLLMTAGHCFNILSCQDFAYIFDFTMIDYNFAPTKFTTDQVYQCLKVEKVSNQGNLDFALIRLDRPTRWRVPLVLNTQQNLQAGEGLYLLGFPSGLPMKFHTDVPAQSVNVAEGYLTAEFDAFGANSGSPVLNVRTNQVEGILVRGEYDFEMDSVANCRRVKKCLPGQCSPEAATLLNPSMAPDPSVKDGAILKVKCCF